MEEELLYTQSMVDSLTFQRDIRAAGLDQAIVLDAERRETIASMQVKIDGLKSMLRDLSDHMYPHVSPDMYEKILELIK